ncbi:hypothetical protein M0R45_003096 [Rubus argutus]|uniref:Uncharacterized protein n=1 Tax=Rubus argutus TaxID=59490 RepID=A0AAW1YC26_RUBAR
MVYSDSQSTPPIPDASESFTVCTIIEPVLKSINPEHQFTVEPSPRDHSSSAGFPACAAIFEQPHRSRRFCPPSPHHPLPPSTPLISQSCREETVVRKLTPLFGHMGKVNYMGGSGKGQFAK